MDYIGTEKWNGLSDYFTTVMGDPKGIVSGDKASLCLGGSVSLP